MQGRAQPSARRARWLCVAYYFPPINRSGTHRTVGFVNHLARAGWDATVLTVEPRDEPIDESLLRHVPSSTTILRVPWYDPAERARRIADWGLAIADWGLRIGDWPSRGTDALTPGRRRTMRTRRSSSVRGFAARLLTTPDSRIGWILPAVQAGLTAIRRRRPDVIYSTSPYASAHLVALILSRWTRAPWVADFRDPWCGNPFQEDSLSILDGWDSMFEWMVLRSAAHVVCCTPTMTEALRRRRAFAGRKCTTILNGFDRERFDDLEPIRLVPPRHFVRPWVRHCIADPNCKAWFTWR
jgi:glycosyltransferase involved in cell wall biosynthesis